MVVSTAYDGTRDTVGVAFTVTDMTVDVTLDCDTDNANAIADVLGTLIRELQAKGIIAGTTLTH